VVTYDSCILISVEKQYIKGNGGVFKLDPRKPPEEAVIWYYALPDSELSSWEGGVIGSAAVSDMYNGHHLAAFMGIDGNLTVVKHDAVTEKMNLGPDSIRHYPKPLKIFSHPVGPSISTPLFTENRLIACGYDGVYLFKYDEDLNFELIDHFGITVESTPIIAGRRIFIASKNGYLYCLGSKD
jgi:outer membrane protein assembly factor BamB